MTQYAVLHGHFYQPPREEPWLELVPREPTAAPAHDWNERITAECYAPLTHAPVLDGNQRIRAVHNAYAHCSFNVGPTLFRWLDEHAPAVADAMVSADRDSLARLGHGNAIATPYHHIIFPLASRRDKVTEVRWGVRDFARRFGRQPTGMWLPETAVDEETLDVLIGEGIRFTILAPHQVSHTPPNGQPARWWSGDRSISLFVYDGQLSHDIAFTQLMRDTDAWEQRFFRSDTDGDAVVALATDGETFGHHHKGGDASLAAIIERLAGRHDIQLTNFEALLASGMQHHDVGLNAPTSWSCAHGIERWRSDCGCRMEPNTSQAWRAPLRDGLCALRDGIDAAVEQLWPADAGDLWAAREAAGADLGGVQSYPADARRLLEAEHHALAMFTSCGWFFDDIGRIEPRLILRHAARALEFFPPERRAPLESALLDALGHARSNDPLKGSGADIWRRDVLREADGPQRLAAGIAALRALAPDTIDEWRLTSHTWRVDGDVITTVHRRTGNERSWITTPHVFGVVADRVTVRDTDGHEWLIGIDRYPAPVRALLEEIAGPLVLDAVLTAADRETVRSGTLSGDALRRVVLERAWEMAARDGIDAADVLLHGAIDLFRLAEAPLPAAIRVDALARLAELPSGPSRDELADRFGVAVES